MIRENRLGWGSWKSTWYSLSPRVTWNRPGAVSCTLTRVVLPWWVAI